MKRERFLLHFTPRELETLREWSKRAADGARMGPASTLDVAELLERVSETLAYAEPVSAERLADIGLDALREDYFADVRSYAEELLAEVLDEEDADEEDADALRETLEERTWERVDGSAWVIYTARAIDVLRVSENDGYALEHFGAEGLVSDGGINWSRLAFGAVYADVSEHLWEDFETWETEREELEEELSEYGLELSSVELRDSGGRRYSEERGWENGPADRYGLSIELPDGSRHHWTLSADATSPNGVCQSTETEPDGTRVALSGPSVPEPVREQALRLLASLRETVRERFAELERAREELSDAEALAREARTDEEEQSERERADILAERVAELEEELSELEDFAGDASA